MYQRKDSLSGDLTDNLIIILKNLKFKVHTNQPFYELYINSLSFKRQISDTFKYQYTIKY